jgi:chromosome condensin MukBEF complex kleisin-like MukF subunit
MARNPISNSKLDDPMHRSSALVSLNALLKETEGRLRELQHARAGIEGIEVAAQMLSGVVTTEEFLDKCVDLRVNLTPLTVGDMDYMTGLVVKSPE